MGREGGAGVDVAEDVGVFVAADPARGSELEGSAGEVGVEGGELVAAEVEGDADLSELLLDGDGSEADGFVVGGFHADVEADAVGAAAIASLVEEGVGGGGIVRVLVGVGGEGPVLRRQEAFGEARFSAVERLDDKRTVDGEGDGGADARRRAGWGRGN